MNFLSGYKTYISAAILLLAALAKLGGVDVPGFEDMDVGAMIVNAMGLFGLRKAIN